MKILHISYIYPPNVHVADGITRVLYYHTKELAKRGHNIEVYTSNLLNLHNNTGLSTCSITMNNVKIRYFRSIFRYKTFIFTPGIISYLFNKKFDFDIIHIHDCRSFQGICAFLSASLKGIPYVYQPHGSFFSGSPTSFIIKFCRILLDVLISKKIILGAQKILVLNNSEKNKYIKIGIPPEKISIIPNGIELSLYNELPKKGFFKKLYKIPDHYKVILYLGRITKTKKISLLIESYGYIIRKLGVNNVVLIISGPDDGYLNELFHLVKKMSLEDSIIFTGFLKEHVKMAALVDADLFIIPSFDGFPVTFLESCIAGTPIITTTNGDYLNWINHVGEITFPSIERLSFAMIKLLSNDDIYSMYSRNCKSIIKEYSIGNVVDQLETLYFKIIKEYALYLLVSI